MSVWFSACPSAVLLSPSELPRKTCTEKHPLNWVIRRSLVTFTGAISCRVIRAELGCTGTYLLMMLLSLCSAQVPFSTVSSKAVSYLHLLVSALPDASALQMCCHMYTCFSFKAHISQLLQQASKCSVQTGRSLNALRDPQGRGTDREAGKLLWEGNRGEEAWAKSHSVQGEKKDLWPTTLAITLAGEKNGKLGEKIWQQDKKKGGANLSLHWCARLPHLMWVVKILGVTSPKQRHCWPTTQDWEKAQVDRVGRFGLLVTLPR